MAWVEGCRRLGAALEGQLLVGYDLPEAFL